jgi:hypothetical protein
LGGRDEKEVSQAAQEEIGRAGPARPRLNQR